MLLYKKFVHRCFFATHAFAINSGYVGFYQINLAKGGIWCIATFFSRSAITVCINSMLISIFVIIQATTLCVQSQSLGPQSYKLYRLTDWQLNQLG
jgi:hypothetical protein